MPGLRCSLRKDVNPGMGNSLCFRKQRHFPRRHDQYRPTHWCPYDRSDGPFHPCDETLDPYQRHRNKEPRLKPASNCCEADYGWKFRSGIPRLRQDDTRWARPKRYPLRKDLMFVRDQGQQEFRPDIHYGLQKPYIPSQNAHYFPRAKPIVYLEPTQSKIGRKYDFRIKQDYVPRRRRAAEELLETRKEDGVGLNFYGSEISERNKDHKERIARHSDSTANKLIEREGVPLPATAYPAPSADQSSRLNDSRGSRLDRVPEFEEPRIPGSSDWRSNLMCNQPSRPPQPWTDNVIDSGVSGLRRSRARVQFHEFKQVNHIYPPSIEVRRTPDVPRDALLPHFPLDEGERLNFRQSGPDRSLRTRLWYPRH